MYLIICKLQDELLDIGADVKSASLLGKEDVVEKGQQGEILLQTAGTENEGTEFKIEQLTSTLGRRMQNIARGRDDIVKVLGWPREGLR